MTIEAWLSHAIALVPVKMASEELMHMLAPMLMNNQWMQLGEDVFPIVNGLMSGVKVTSITGTHANIIYNMILGDG